MRKAKIVATIGPASQKLEVLEAMAKAGLNVVRMNMSHGDYDFHQKTLDLVEQVEKKTGKILAVLMDLQGPKIRVAKLKEPLKLKKEEVWEIGEEKFSKGNNFIPTIYKNLVKDVSVGHRVLFDDGLLEAMVIKKNNNTVAVKIVTGGDLKSNKGINLPDSKVSAPALSSKDKEDLLWGLTKSVDYVALSFVKKTSDILTVKKIMQEKGKNLPIISKIEVPEALENIEAITEVSEGIMIARGDMAVEVGPHLVPKYQKQIIRLCNQKGKPVITATQMLESMTFNTSPTRAEASDVFNAILDGTDAVMLSGETATGIDPENVIKTMDKIVKEAETVPKKRKYLLEPSESFTTNVQQAGMTLAESTNAKIILAITQKGVSCQRLSAFKPKVPIIGVTNNVSTLKKLCLFWGVNPYLHLGDLYSEQLEDKVLANLKKQGLIQEKDNVVICRANASDLKDGKANCVKVKKV